MEDILNVSAMTDDELYQKQTLLNQRLNIASQMFSGDLTVSLMNYLRLVESEIQIRQEKIYSEYINKSPSVINTDEIKITKDTLKSNKKLPMQRKHNIIKTKHPVYDKSPKE